MSNCFRCDQPATLVNHTQFAGTHYWCDEHVPPEDRADCSPITTLNPQYLTVKFDEHFTGGFATRPQTVTCWLYYQDPKLPEVQATATSHTHHRAKAEAYNFLKAEVAKAKAAYEAKSHPGKTYLDLDSFQTAPLETQPPNPYTHDRVQYLLDKLQEEAAEVVQAVSKIRRFGPHNHHPDRTTTNLQELVGELEDFQAIIWALEETQYLDPKPSTTQTIKKYQALMG